MFVDTHAHLYHPKFNGDRDAMIERAFEAGVQAILMPAIDVPSIEAALRLCERYDGLYAMSAIHPSDVKEATDADFEQVVGFCAHPKVVAVGESGLDYYWDRTFDAKQHDYLRRHVRLAAEADLPLVLHNRDATPDLIRIIREERAALPEPDRLRGVFHCFTGTPAEAEVVAGLGFLIGLGGILTFKNGGLDEVAAAAPLDQILLETDAPFLAPTPHRGKRNEPAYVPLVADKLAAVRGLSVEDVARHTTANAHRLFHLPNAFAR